MAINEVRVMIKEVITIESKSLYCLKDKVNKYCKEFNVSNIQILQNFDSTFNHTFCNGYIAILTIKSD